MPRSRFLTVLVPALWLAAGCTYGAPRVGHDGGDEHRLDGVDAGSAAEPLDGCPLPAQSPQKSAVFASPGAEGDFAVEDALVALIDAAAPGSRIRLAIHTLDSRRIAEALVVAAVTREVNIALVIDEGNQVQADGMWTWNASVAQLMNELGSNRVIVCGGGHMPPDGGGCMGKRSQHNSFALFAELCDGSKHVVAQASGGFSKQQLRRHTDIAIIRDDLSLYEAMDDYWRDLRSDVRDDDYHRLVDGDSSTRALLFPRAPTATTSVEPATDSIYNILDQGVVCKPGDTVRLAMSAWTDNRDYLVDALDRLETEGCDVQMVLADLATRDAIKERLAARFAADKITYLPDMDHKFLLIDAQYQQVDQRVFWIGSADFTLSSLRANDESILRIVDDELFDAYLDHWNALARTPK